MFGVLITAIKFIFLLGFLVLIHEGGHFIVAKLCKVRVHEFAIGFGPNLIKKKIGDTVYALRAIPLGGFVRMEGEEEHSDSEDSFGKKSIPKRIAIVVAGGGVNIIFGLLVYFILATSSGNYISNVVEYVLPEANNLQLHKGDKIVKIDDKTIHLKSDLDNALAQSNGESLNVEVERNGEILSLDVVPIKEDTKNTGIYFSAVGSELNTKVEAVYPESPAEKAGLMKDDVIVKVNGEDVGNNPYKVVNLTQEAENNSIVYTIRRDDKNIDITVNAEIISQYYLGVELLKADNNLLTNINYGFWDTINFSVSIIDNLKTLFTGNVSVDQLMGPIGISSLVADTNGFLDFIYVLALISLALGVTNLLPIPPLDGWKVVVYIIEAIRRKPMNERIQINIESFGFILMIMLSLYVAYNDVLRIF